MTRTDTIKTIRGLVEEINSACGGANRSSFNQIKEYRKLNAVIRKKLLGMDS